MRSIQRFLLVMVVGIPCVAMALDWRVLPPGEVPADARQEKLKTLDDYFPFTPPSDLKSWEIRRERVQRQILVAAGLWPMPERPPIQAVIHGAVDRGDYTVEKVYFESYPGFYVTGNLYRPKKGQGPFPGVLCPHGHWKNGRFYDAGLEQVRWDIVNGAERFEVGGRSPLQARCVQLARMGCVVFHYDMVGYADSRQLPHRPGVRQAMNTTERWGYFSPAAELHLQNILGLQTFNSIRALDFLLSLPDVDAKRIGVTGASGGGTQTFLLCAVDPRPTVSFPAVMVSTAMQGGCTCENASYLRIDTGNIEFAALFAPKPLGMTAADDWTREIATKGLPELKQLYTLYGVPNNVMAKPLLHFPHNYNYVSREVMYHWMNKHLSLGLKEPIIEEDYHPLSQEEMTVWDAAHPAPPGGEEFEREFLARLTEATRRQMESLIPDSPEAWQKYANVIGGAYDVMIGRGLPENEDLSVDVRRETQEDSVTARYLLIHQPSRKETVPVLVLVPASPRPTVVIWVSPNGKQGILAEDGKPIPVIRKMLEQKLVVVTADLFGQGETTPDGKNVERQRLVRDDYAGYTFGYNPPLYAQRVHDLLKVIRFARSQLVPEGKLIMIGPQGAAHWVAGALAQAKGAVDLTVVDTGGFRFQSINAFDHPDFFPGAAKYLDLPGLLSIAAPAKLWLAGENSEGLSLIRRVYHAAPAEGQLRAWDSLPMDENSEWLKSLIESL
ncbi:MAG TPA: acetylxylan esterase [Thermogutta sp.]|nr:acetylxylan esterase [Thermogutta sp.]